MLSDHVLQKIFQEVKENPKRVIFNPGTENPIFAQKLQEKGIPWENACTLVLLSTNQYKS